MTLSAKLLLLLVILLFAITSVVTAYSNYDHVYEEEYVERVGPGYSILRNWVIEQVFYQKFRTGNTTLTAHYIIIYYPKNMTSTNPWLGEQYIRLGILETNATGDGPLLTPAQFLAANYEDRFRCDAPKWLIPNPGNVDYLHAYRVMAYGDYFLEPNTNYYIGWYQHSNFQSRNKIMYFPAGDKTGAFDEWAIHRGNVTGDVWTDAFPVQNLTFDVWGYNMNASVSTTALGAPSQNTSFKVTSWINSYNSWGRNWTWGYWYGNDTTDVDSFEVNVTVGVNTSVEFYEVDTLTGLTAGQFYHVRGWIYKNASYPFVLGTEAYYLTKPDGPTNLTDFRTTTTTTLNWTAGDSFESNLRTVIFRTEDGWVNDPGAEPIGNIVYNDTGITTTFASGGGGWYYTAFSFLQAEENGVNLSQWSTISALNYSIAPPLDYNISVKQEKDPYKVFPVTTLFEYEFATADHEVILQDFSTNNPVAGIYVQNASILTVRFNITATGPTVERTMVLNESELTEDRNLTIYMPNAPAGDNKGDTRPVTIFFKDSTGHFTVQDYAVGTIRKYIENDTVEIHSDYVQADNAIRTYLITGDQYYFYARSDSLAEVRLGGLLIYDEYYSIDVVSESIDNSSWRLYVDINSGWEGASGDNKTVWLDLYDSTTGLYNTIVRLYDNDGILLKTSEYTLHTAQKAYNFNFTYDTELVNRTAYFANIYMKYHKGPLWWNSSTNYFWSTDTSGIEVDLPYLDKLLNATLGESPIYIPSTDSTEEIQIPYSILLITGIVVLFLFLLPGAYAVFSLIFSAIIMAFCRLMGLVTASVLSDFSIFIILSIGIMVYLITRYGGYGKQIERTRIVLAEKSRRLIERPRGKK